MIDEDFVSISMASSMKSEVFQKQKNYSVFNFPWILGFKTC